MRILHLYSGNLYGGIESILVALARGRQVMPDVEHEFGLCFAGGRLAQDLAAANARVHAFEPVRFTRPLTIRAARRFLDGLMAGRKFDRVVCHAPWSQAVFGRSVRRSGVPLVFWAHDAMTGRHWTERLAKRVAPDLVIANSHYTASTVAAVYPGVPLAVVYAPVEQPAPLGAGERERLRTSLQTAGDAVVVIQASRSEAWKGHALVVEALSPLAHMPGWVWWQVGGAQRPVEEVFLDSIRKASVQARIDDRIRWVGPRADVPRLLAAADIYCQANSRPEPFGIVFVEALAAGIPVVTTSLGGAREIVDESSGILVPPGDTPALTHALHRLITDAPYRRSLGSNAPARAARLCQPAGQIRQLYSALADLREAVRA
jgi:glycosyltransferase involved in cell wall biosynthesis